MSFNFIRHLDILKCDHGGLVRVDAPNVGKKYTLCRSGRILTEEELKKAIIVGCTQIGAGQTPCTKITAVVQGKAKEIKTDNEIPLLRNLNATTNGQPPGIVTVSNDLKDQLKQEEDKNPPSPDLKMYFDTKGIKTIGHGFNLEQNGARGDLANLGYSSQDIDDIMNGTKKITAADAEALMDNKIADKAQLANSEKVLNGFSDEQQRGIMDFLYNIKNFPNGWTELSKALKAGDSEKAAFEVGHDQSGTAPSKYVGDVGPTRSARVISEIRGADVLGEPDGAP